MNSLSTNVRTTVQIGGSILLAAAMMLAILLFPLLFIRRNRSTQKSAQLTSFESESPSQVDSGLISFASLAG